MSNVIEKLIEEIFSDFQNNGNIRKAIIKRQKMRSEQKEQKSKSNKKSKKVIAKNKPKRKKK